MALIRSALTRSRSTSRGSVQEEMIDDDQEFIRGTDEVERAESGVWRIPFELGVWVGLISILICSIIQNLKY